MTCLTRGTDVDGKVCPQRSLAIRQPATEATAPQVDFGAARELMCAIDARELMYLLLDLLDLLVLVGYAPSDQLHRCLNCLRQASNASLRTPASTFSSVLAPLYQTVLGQAGLPGMVLLKN